MEDDQFDDLPTFMVLKKGKKKVKQIRDVEYDEDTSTNVSINASSGESRSLKVVALLREKSLDYVLKQYKLNCKHHSKFPNLCQLSYSQLESPMGSPIVQECRGLILDESNNWNIVAFPFRKFFNYSEPLAAQIDWTTATVMEKLDGSIMTVYFYDNTWQVSSSGLPDASGRVGTLQTNREDGSQVPLTYASLFWQVWNIKNYALPVNKNRCYMFELVTEKNQVICRYEKEQLSLIGCRDLKTLEEINPFLVAKEHNWEVPKTFPVKSLDEALKLSRDLSPTASEGFVVCDKHFKRIKIKSPQYVVLSGMLNTKETKKERKFLEIIRINETEEFLAYFPEWKQEFQEMKEKYNKLYLWIESTFSKLKKSKNFQKEIEKYVFRDLLLKFKMNSSLTVKKALAELPIKTLEQYIEAVPNISETSSEFETLNKQILDFVASIEVTPEISKNIQLVIQKVEKIVRITYPDAIIRPFGSIASGIGTKTSDLDLCLFFEQGQSENVNTAGEKVFYLEDLGDILKKHGMINVTEVPTARYPIVEFEEPETKTKVDISFGNHLGVRKAEYILFFSKLEPKFKQLVLIVKYWAKQRQINNPAQYTLNSFVLALMVLHFLQHKKLLPILPRKAVENPEKPEYEYKIDFKSPTQSPSVAELLRDFFEYYLKFDYVNTAITLRNEEGTMPKEQTAIATQSKTPMVFVLEDPFIVIENTARTVTNHTLHDIRVELNRACQLLEKTKDITTVCASVKNKKKERSMYEIPTLEYMSYK